MDQEYLWFYQSDINQTSLTHSKTEWNFYKEHNDDIEAAYQLFLMRLESEIQDDIIESSIYELDHNIKIDFLHNIQKDDEQERLIGRFSGDVTKDRELKNLLTSTLNRWFYSTSYGNSNWTRFQTDINNEIDKEFKKYYLSMGSNIYEYKNFIFDFKELTMMNKIDLKTVKISRNLECPQSSRTNFLIKEIKPKLPVFSKISEDNFIDIEKDYFLNFKNIFPSDVMTQKIVKFYLNKETYSIIFRSYQKINEDASNSLLDQLNEEGFEEMCELTKTCNVNEFEVNFKIKIPFQLMSRISKPFWYFKYFEGNNEFWKQFTKEENLEIDHAYKIRYLKNNEEEVYLGDASQRKLLRFKSSKYFNLINNEIDEKTGKTIMRYYPKYANSDEITRIFVPEEVFEKTKKENQLKTNRDSPILYANKFGPKNFVELINEIKNELKNESKFLNNINMYDKYDQKYLSYINYVNFTDKIVKIYTEEGFVYRRMNKVLRDKDYEAFWKMKYYYFSLLYSFQILISQRNTSITLYRGLCNLKPETIDFYLKTLKVNEMLIFNEFTSTSTDMKIALQYAKKQGLLFEIEVSKEAAIRIADISNISVFNHEKEVVISSGSILKCTGKCEEQEQTQNTIKLSLVESNTKAFFNFINNCYDKNFIDLNKVELDFYTIESLFQAANSSSKINQILLTLHDSSLLYSLARLIIDSTNLKYIKIKKEGEMKKNQIIKFTHIKSNLNENTPNISYNKCIAIEMKNFSEEDYTEFLNEIIQQIKVIICFQGDKMNQKAFEHFTKRFRNVNTLTSLVLKRESNKIRLFNNLKKSDNEGFNDLIEMFKNSSELKFFTLNIFNDNELGVIVDSLKYNFNLSNINIIYNKEKLSPIKKRITVKRKSQNLTIDLFNFDKDNFHIFLGTYLTKENKINELGLSNNTLYPSLINVLVNYLEENDSLEYLDLEKTLLKNNDLTKISKAISENKSLKTINLQNNRLNNEVSTIYDIMIKRGIKLDLNYNDLNFSEFIPKHKPNEDFKCIKTLYDHRDRVTSLIILSNGLIVSGSDDMSIKIWDPNDDYRCIQTLLGHEMSVTCLMKLTDDKIVSGSEDCTIKIWDLNDDYKCIKTLIEHEKSVLCIIKLTDGRIVSGSDDKKIKIWDPNDDYKCIKSIEGHREWVQSLMLLSDGKIVSGSGDNSIKIWDQNEDYKCFKTLEQHHGYIYSLILLTNGMMVSASDDNSIKIWDLNDDYKCIKTLEEHKSYVVCLMALTDGNFLSGSGDKSIKIWDSNDDYKCIKTLEEHGDTIWSLMKLRDGKIVSGSGDKSIKIWELNYDYKCIKSLEDHEGTIFSLMKLTDGKIVSGAGDNSIKIWDPNQDYKCSKTLIEHGDYVYCLILLTNGFIASGSGDRYIKIWDPNQDYKCIKTLIEHGDSVNSLLKLIDGKIVSGSGDKTIKIWDPNEDYKCIKTMEEHGDAVISLILLTNGMIVSGSRDNLIKIWDPNQDYNCIKTLDEHRDYVFSLISLTNGMIASGSGDRYIKIWDPNNDYKCIKTLERQKDSVVSFVTLSDGNFVSGSGDGSIQIWDTNNDYNCIKKIQIHEHSITSIILLSNGRIISGSRDKTIKIMLS